MACSDLLLSQWSWMFIFYIKKNKFIIVIFIIIAIAITQAFASFLYFNDNLKVANAPLKDRFQKTQKDSLIINNKENKNPE